MLGWSLAIVGAIAFGVWMWVFDGRSIWGKSSKAEVERATKSGAAVTVEITSPLAGGIDRVCIQPGTIEPFESADLYAKVSGFLIETVDIETTVRKGQVLARISVPEYERQVEKDTASVKNASAKVKQMEAHLAAAQAEEKAAKQMIAQANIEMKSKAAYRSYRFKQLERIKLLYADRAVDAKYVDETTDHYEAAFEAENGAREAVATAQLRSEAAAAKVTQAEADIDEAKAEVEVAKAELEKAKVLLEYTTIRSPYDGVVTKRNFFRGDFIRSADAGGERTPVLAVDRTDWMRVVVQVPDRDVPYVDRGDAAEIEIDALPGKPLIGIVARSAQSEDQQTRTMRTEIDIPNTDGKLRRNMYGRVKITLQAGSPSALRVSSAALVSREGQHAMVRVVRDHQVHFAPIEIGLDTGAEIEVLKGLNQSDRVILKANGPIDEGTKVSETESGKIANPH